MKNYCLKCGIYWAHHVPEVTDCLEANPLEYPLHPRYFTEEYEKHYKVPELHNAAKSSV